MTRMERGAGIASGIGLLACAIGWMMWPAQFYFAWLAALTAFLGWPLGSLALLLVHAQTGGRWGVVIRPALVAGVATLPVLIPALVPLLFGLDVLYPWLRPGVRFANAFYLNAPFLAARVAAYLLCWFVLAALTLRAVRRGDKGLQGMAPVGLMVLALTMTFAAIDATMSLDPHFNSTVYGLIALAGAGLLALSVAVAIVAAAAPASMRADLGKLLLGLVVLWAYLDFMQLLIVWEANLASEAGWYAIRSAGVWAWVFGLIGLLHLLLPFAVLLSPRLRRSAQAMVAVAVLLIGMEILRSWWLVLPASGHGIDPLAVFAVLAVGGGAVFCAARAMPRPVPA